MYKLLQRPVVCDHYSHYVQFIHIQYVIHIMYTYKYTRKCVCGNKLKKIVAHYYRESRLNMG